MKEEHKEVRKSCMCSCTFCVFVFDVWLLQRLRLNSVLQNRSTVRWTGPSSGETHHGRFLLRWNRNLRRTSGDFWANFSVAPRPFPSANTFGCWFSVLRLAVHHEKRSLKSKMADKEERRQVGHDQIMVYLCYNNHYYYNVTEQRWNTLMLVLILTKFQFLFKKNDILMGWKWLGIPSTKSILNLARRLGLLCHDIHRHSLVNSQPIPALQVLEVQSTRLAKGYWYLCLAVS